MEMEIEKMNVKYEHTNLDGEGERGGELSKAEYSAILAKIAVELARRLRQVSESAQSAGPDMVAPGGIPEWVRENTLLSCLADIRSIEDLLTLSLEGLGLSAPEAPKRGAKRGGQKGRAVTPGAPEDTGAAGRLADEEDQMTTVHIRDIHIRDMFSGSMAYHAWRLANCDRCARLDREECPLLEAADYASLGASAGGLAPGYVSEDTARRMGYDGRRMGRCTEFEDGGEPSA